MKKQIAAIEKIQGSNLIKSTLCLIHQALGITKYA